eukprot:tig00020563_g11350.t1
MSTQVAAVQADGQEIERARGGQTSTRVAAFQADVLEIEPREAAAGGSEIRNLLSRLGAALFRRILFAGRLFSGRKRGRSEFEFEESMPAAGEDPQREEQEEDADEISELRAALQRAQQELAAERALPATKYTYPYPVYLEHQIPAALDPCAPQSVAVQTDDVAEPRGERAKLQEAILAARLARRDCLQQRTGVFVAVVRGGDEEPGPAPLPDDVLLHVFKLIVERGRREEALLQAHQVLCAAMRVSRRWHRLASDPSLWSTFDLQAHVFQLPWTFHALATLPRFRSLTHLDLDVLFPDYSSDFSLEVIHAFEDGCASSRRAGRTGVAPPPLSSVRFLSIRFFKTRVTDLLECPEWRNSSKGQPREYGYIRPVPEQLPWFPASTSSFNEFTRRGRLCNTTSYTFPLAGAMASAPPAAAAVSSSLTYGSDLCLHINLAAGILRVSERFPGLQELWLPQQRAGCLPAIISLGGPCSMVERLDARAHFGTKSHPGFRQAFPRLRWLRSAVAYGPEGVTQLLAALTPEGDPSASPAAAATAVAVDKLVVIEMDFNELEEAEQLRACLQRVKPRVLVLNACFGLHHLGGTLGPSCFVETLALGTVTLFDLEPADLPWLAIAGGLTSIRELCLKFDRLTRYKRAGATRLLKAAFALPSLRRLVLYNPKPALFDAATLLANLRAERGLEPVAVSKKNFADGDSAGILNGPCGPFLVRMFSDEIGDVYEDEDECDDHNYKDVDSDEANSDASSSGATRKPARTRSDREEVEAEDEEGEGEGRGEGGGGGGGLAGGEGEVRMRTWDCAQGTESRDQLEAWAVGRAAAL